VPFGDSPYGKYGALYPEPLHQFLKGLVQRGVLMTVQLVDKHGGNDAVVLLDLAFATLRPSRQSDRASVPIASFSAISNCTKVQGQEYPAMLVQLMAILAADVDAALLPRPRALKVIKSLDHLYRMWIWLSQEELELDDLRDGGAFQRRVEM
jgi:hypothetical protein